MVEKKTRKKWGLRLQPVDIYVSKKLASRRTELGMTQQVLAKEIGVSFQQIQKFEKGENRISAHKLYLYAKALKVPVRYFFEGYADDNFEEMPIVRNPQILVVNRLLADMGDKKGISSLIDIIKRLIKYYNTF